MKRILSGSAQVPYLLTSQFCHKSNKFVGYNIMVRIAVSRRSVGRLAFIYVLWVRYVSLRSRKPHVVITDFNTTTSINTFSIFIDKTLKKRITQTLHANMYNIKITTLRTKNITERHWELLYFFKYTQCVPPSAGDTPSTCLQTKVISIYHISQMFDHINKINCPELCVNGHQCACARLCVCVLNSMQHLRIASNTCSPPNLITSYCRVARALTYNL